MKLQVKMIHLLSTHLRNALSILLLFAVGMSLLAQSGVDHYFEQGNKAYRESDYRTSLQWYQKIEATGFTSSEVYYNMANCYFKLNRIGPSILFYEKALKLNPDDEEAQFNLELANLRVVDRIEPFPQLFLFQWWEDLHGLFSQGQLTVIVAVLYILSIMLAIALLYNRNGKRRLLYSLLSAAAVLTLFATYLLVSNINSAEQNAPAIIMAPSVNILSAPDANSSDVFVLHEGTKVKLTDQRGEWVKILLSDGKSGWMTEDKLGRI